MYALEKFLTHAVERLMVEYRRGKTPNLLPIDLGEVARIAGVRSIEEREMIPEAVLQARSDGFRIFVQSNFKGLPGNHARSRFSIAHEIAHTLFFETQDGVARPIKEAPTGDNLEVACHNGASLLLLPTPLLKDAIGCFSDFPRAEDLISLARQFDVSMEVLLRRLRSLEYFESPERAPILVRGPRELIEYAVYPGWLKRLPTNPERGTPFGDWFGQGGTIELADPARSARANVLVRRTNSATISARRVEVSDSLAIYEVVLMPAEHAQPIVDDS
jgi:IrrE N-terminal-like domain